MLVILLLHSLSRLCSRGLVIQPLFPGESGVDQLVEIIKVVLFLSILLGVVLSAKKMTSVRAAYCLLLFFHKNVPPFF